MSSDMQLSLAWYRYPEPGGTHYGTTELNDPETVKILFDYCQTLLALISREGWQHLYRTHGEAQLLALNKESGWFDTDSEYSAKRDLHYQCLLAGYDPVNDTLGKYDHETGLFCSDAGEKRHIPPDEIG